MAAATITIAILILLGLCSAAQSFVFNSFKSAQSNLTLAGSALVTSTGVLQLTNSSRNQSSHAFFSAPFQLLSRRNLTSPVSFSTTFIFSILTAIPSGAGGHGFTFAISPTSTLPFYPSSNPNYFALFSPSTDSNPSNHILAVEFDTAQLAALDSSTSAASNATDINDNHIGIDINGMNTIAATPAAFFDSATRTLTPVQMESDVVFQVWIDYIGPLQTLNITIAPLRHPKPSKPLISKKLNLSQVFKPSMFVGFTSATGKLASAHYILAWSFRLHKPARPLDLSKLPPRPTRPLHSSKFKPTTGFRIGGVTAASTFLVILCFIVASVFVIRRLRLRDHLEKWELDFPHRFRYAELYRATNGFSSDRIVGRGGFGCVYRGVVSKTKQEIAVKKIAHDSKQGLKEFVAEVATLGRLRHRHLVHLEGWCKRSSHLLLVYEFMSNGSLDSFLFNSSRRLGWAQRFKILNQVAAGLVYLHHEWEQVVVHRDVKANNVLLDFEMNAKLGDFGLAKLHEHGVNPCTTRVVGTVGYIAPELAHDGRATRKSDVYAFGALVFEVVCGRRPLEGEVLVQDWAFECYKMGCVWKVVDQKLGSEYVESEVEIALKVGLLCSQYEAEARPSMEQVARYLGGFDPLPEAVEGVVWKTGERPRLGGAMSDPVLSGGVMSTASFSLSGR